MAKKTLFVILAVIVLCLCCGVCFAAEGNGDSINLGNQIMESIDKTGESFNNVVSGNATKDMGNGIRDGVNNVKNGVEDAGNAVVNRTTRDGDYNAIRTQTEGTATGNGLEMTTTTWMWIILVVAAVIIIAAIWYYATQNNS